MPLFSILAKNEHGAELLCFTWRGQAQFGIARAKSEAKKLGLTLTDFRAHLIPE